MHIVPVETRKTELAFINFPRKLYRNDPSYVVPFDRDIKKAFNRNVNPYFSHGDAVRWIAVNEKNQTLGRIAAFYDRVKDESDYVRSGGCGFFESIDDRQVAFLLFDTAKNMASTTWLCSHDGAH